MTKDQLYPFSNFILKSYDMTKDNTKFVIIQDELNYSDQQKIPMIYEWLSINTPAKYLYDLVDSSLNTNINDKRNKIEYQLFTLDNKKIENDEKEIRSVSGSHIIEIKIVSPDEKGKPK